MSGGRGRILLIMLTAVVALAAGETLLAKGMKLTDRSDEGGAALIAAVLRNGWVWAGCLLLVAHLALYMLALRGADLSFALPLTAASYPLGALLAKTYLHESVSASRWIGVVLITVGVAVVAFGDATAKR